MHGDGVDEDGFPPAETPWGRRDMIVVIVEPIGPDECRMSWRTEHDMTPEEVVRDLRTAADIIESNGTPGVTSTGIIVAGSERG